LGVSSDLFDGGILDLTIWNKSLLLDQRAQCSDAVTRGWSFVLEILQQCCFLKMKVVL
jgi:hypothetical protein